MYRMRREVRHVPGRKLLCGVDVASVSACASATWPGAALRSTALAACRSMAGTVGVRLPLQSEGIPGALVSDPGRPKAR